MKKPKLTRKSVRILLILVGILTLVAMSLMIFSEKNLHNTIIDIIILMVGSIALVMAVLTEAQLERHSRKFSEIHHEILEALAEIREINQDNEVLKRKLSQEFKLDKEISEKLDKMSEK